MASNKERCSLGWDNSKHSFSTGLGFQQEKVLADKNLRNTHKHVQPLQLQSYCTTSNTKGRV